MSSLPEPLGGSPPSRTDPHATSQPSHSTGPTTLPYRAVPESSKTPSTSDGVAPSDALLDAASYPHIIDRIIYLADLPALIRLRAVSKAFLDSANSRIFGHVFLTTKDHEWHLDSPEPPYSRLPFLPILPPMIEVREPDGAITYAPRPAAPNKLSPLGDPLRYTHTVDAYDTMLGPNWSPFPEFPSLVRSRGSYSLFSGVSEYVSYVDLRGCPFCHVPSSEVPVQWILHVFFDEEWWTRSVPLNGEEPSFGPVRYLMATSLKCSHLSISLILHPMHTIPPISVPNKAFPTTRRFLSPPQGLQTSNTATFSVVGLEKCRPEMFGLPPGMSHEEVIRQIKALDDKMCQVRFLTLDDWAYTKDPLAVELPAHMVHVATPRRLCI